MERKWEELSNLFGNSDVSVDCKINNFLTCYNIERKNHTTYSKILCYLGYRYLEQKDYPTRTTIDIDDVITRIKIQLIELLKQRENVWSIWTESLNTILGYITLIRDKDTNSFVNFANEGINAYRHKLNPGGITNFSRLTTLRYAITREDDNFINQERIFKQSVDAFPVIDKKPWFIDCLTKSCKALEISSYIKHIPTDKKRIMKIDLEQPFNTALSVCINN